jgi:hypothetical protein
MAKKYFQLHPWPIVMMTKRKQTLGKNVLQTLYRVLRVQYVPPAIDP